MRQNAPAIPTAAAFQPGQRILARFEIGFYEATIGTVDKGDMVNPAKALIRWDDNTESWAPLHDIRLL